MEKNKYDKFMLDLYEGKYSPCPECGKEQFDKKDVPYTIYHFHCEYCGFTMNIN
ncbi:MAG: hypothetical protein ACI4N4_02145 [Candidatus Fimenecus sp.]